MSQGVLNFVQTEKVSGAPGWLSRLSVYFGSGHDLMVHEIDPLVGLLTVSKKPAWASLSPSLSAPPLLSL